MTDPQRPRTDLADAARAFLAPFTQPDNGHCRTCQGYWPDEHRPDCTYVRLRDLLEAEAATLAAPAGLREAVEFAAREFKRLGRENSHRQMVEALEAAPRSPEPHHFDAQRPRTDFRTEPTP